VNLILMALQPDGAVGAVRGEVEKTVDRVASRAIRVIAKTFGLAICLALAMQLVPSRSKKAA
jgi:hypothetical protein